MQFVNENHASFFLTIKSEFKAGIEKNYYTFTYLIEYLCEKNQKPLAEFYNDTCFNAEYLANNALDLGAINTFKHVLENYKIDGKKTIIIVENAIRLAVKHEDTNLINLIKSKFDLRNDKLIHFLLASLINFNKLKEYKPYLHITKNTKLYDREKERYYLRPSIRNNLMKCAITAGSVLQFNLTAKLLGIGFFYCLFDPNNPKEETFRRCLKNYAFGVMDYELREISTGSAKHIYIPKIIDNFTPYLLTLCQFSTITVFAILSIEPEYEYHNKNLNLLLNKFVHAYDVKYGASYRTLHIIQQLDDIVHGDYPSGMKDRATALLNSMTAEMNINKRALEQETSTPRYKYLAIEENPKLTTIPTMRR